MFLKKNNKRRHWLMA